MLRRFYVAAVAWLASKAGYDLLSFDSAADIRETAAWLRNYPRRSGALVRVRTQRMLRAVTKLEDAAHVLSESLDKGLTHAGS